MSETWLLLAGTHSRGKGPRRAGEAAGSPSGGRRCRAQRGRRAGLSLSRAPLQLEETARGTGASPAQGLAPQKVWGGGLGKRRGTDLGGPPLLAVLPWEWPR